MWINQSQFEKTLIETRVFRNINCSFFNFFFDFNRMSYQLQQMQAQGSTDALLLATLGAQVTAMFIRFLSFQFLSFHFFSFLFFLPFFYDRLDHWRPLVIFRHFTFFFLLSSSSSFFFLLLLSSFFFFFSFSLLLLLLLFLLLLPCSFFLSLRGSLTL